MNIIPNPDSITQEDQCFIIDSFKILKHYNDNNLDSKEIIDEDVKSYFDNEVRSIGWTDTKWIDNEQCILMNTLDSSLPNNVHLDRNNNTYSFLIYDNNTKLFINGNLNKRNINKINSFINESLYDKLAVLDFMFSSLKKEQYIGHVIRNDIITKSKNNIHIYTRCIESSNKKCILSLHGDIDFIFCNYGIYLNLFENTIYVKYNNYLSSLTEFNLLKINKNDINDILNNVETEYYPLDEFTSNPNSFRDLFFLTKENYEKGIANLASLVKNRLNNLDDVTLLNLVRNNFETI